MKLRFSRQQRKSPQPASAVGIFDDAKRNARTDRQRWNLVNTWPRKAANLLESKRATKSGAVHRLPKYLYYRIHGMPLAMRKAVAS